MSGSGAAYYDEELKYLYRLLKNLPDVIPEGNAHDFTNYVPDPQKTKDFGKVWTAKLSSLHSADAELAGWSEGSAVGFRANTHPHLFPDSSTILGPYRSNLWSALSTHAHATARGAPCERVPCGVEHDLRILRYPVLAPLAGVYTPLFIPVPTDMRSSARTGMLIPS
ncbi:hypothetical protein DFH08DRAFT_1078503 [Mycena albidolilacea]|uniref:Uncharacterized protein n=1 Tax=Mycena albidolilacea TaxID=1033008 RepID=A0AAD7A824_9AGAR|nr:hypothetical protein DFH08DRAFT_1078503 [Mycena albidolilacea]